MAFSPFGSTYTGGYKVGQLQQYTPQQLELFDRMFNYTSPESQTARLAGGDQSAFGQLEAPALRQFSDIQSGIANRFSGTGMGSRRSSGFRLAQNQAAQDFAGQLQSQRLALQRQAMMDLRGMSSELLGARPYENFLVQPQQRPNFAQRLVGGAAPVAGAALGGLLGGWPGAAVGGSIGSQFAEAFQ